MKKSIFTKTTLFIAAITSSLLISGCGKDETAGGLVGAGAGAMVGTAVAGRNSKGEGAVLGGLVGSYIGAAVGKSSDRERERKERQRRNDAHRRERHRLESENRRLQEQMRKWCADCGKLVRLQSAQSCPDCGGGLIREKFCNRCKTVFSPESGYRFCPYCNVKVELRGR